jgi:hypothetical protein
MGLIQKMPSLPIPARFIISPQSGLPLFTGICCPVIDENKMLIKNVKTEHDQHENGGYSKFINMKAEFLLQARKKRSNRRVAV